MNREELIKKIDEFVDTLIVEKQIDQYNKVISTLGGEPESDLDDLLEEATDEQLQNVEKIMNPEINKTKRADVFFIDPRLLRIEEGFNTRQDYGDLDELTASIIENGVKVPLRGYKEGDFYVLNDGHRRFLAVNKALNQGVEIARVPFISEKKKSLEERIFDIILFNDGKNLTPLELGETYKKLVAYGYNFTEIAKKIGKTVKHVSDMVGVAGASKEVKELIQDKTVSASLVAEIQSKTKNDQETEDLIKTVSAIKKETSQGDKKKEKVTKKDVIDLIPEKPKKEKEKVEIGETEQETFTKDQVIQLLKDQRKACAAEITIVNLKIKVLNVELVLV